MPSEPIQGSHSVSTTTEKGAKKLPERAASIAGGPLDLSKQWPARGGELGKGPQRDLHSKSPASRCEGSGLFFLLLMLMLLLLLCRQWSVLPSHGCAMGWLCRMGPASLHSPPAGLVPLVPGSSCWSLAHGTASSLHRGWGECMGSLHSVVSPSTSKSSCVDR